MPWSKNFQNCLALWVSDKTKDEINELCKLTGMPKTRIVRKSVAAFVELFRKNPEKWREFLINGDETCRPPTS